MIIRRMLHTTHFTDSKFGEMGENQTVKQRNKQMFHVKQYGDKSLTQNVEQNSVSRQNRRESFHDG